MKRHAPFFFPLVAAAVLLGVLAGFSLGAYFAALLALGATPPQWFGAAIQIHGHIQLLGWTGLFIIAVSLYKLPRLTSTPPLPPGTLSIISATVLAGLLLRTGGQLGLAFNPQASMQRTIAAFGCVLESAGMIYFAVLGLSRIISYKAQPGAYAASSIKPFLVVSIAGWVSYAVLNGLLGVDFLSKESDVFTARLNSLGIDYYLHGVLLPTCLAYSLSTFPIFLRLRAPNWPVWRPAALYAAGFACLLLAPIVDSLQAIGAALRGLAVLWVVWKLDLLRLNAPWFVKFRGHSDRANRPPRRAAADYGQFGNFEWLLYSAYIWLVAGVLLDLAGALGAANLSGSVVRHIYFLGFVTQLILGMAARMIPGFLGMSCVPHPNLVRMSFALISVATLGRIAPLLFDSANSYPLRALFGLSGVFALSAILCLAINVGEIYRTKR